MESISLAAIAASRARGVAPGRGSDGNALPETRTAASEVRQRLDGLAASRLVAGRRAAFARPRVRHSRCRARVGYAERGLVVEGSVRRRAPSGSTSAPGASTRSEPAWRRAHGRPQESPERAGRRPELLQAARDRRMRSENGHAGDARCGAAVAAPVVLAEPRGSRVRLRRLPTAEAAVRGGPGCGRDGGRPRTRLPVSAWSRCARRDHSARGRSREPRAHSVQMRP